MAYHTGVHSKRSADAVEGLLNALYTNRRDYEYIKQNYKQLAGALAYQAAKRKITADPEKTADVMEKAFEKTFKIIDKLLPEVNEKNLEILGRAIHKHTNDPFVVLRNAGIDIEPELEEFRQFLAEINGKKIEAQKTKSPAVKGAVEPKEETPETIKLESQKLLGILSGLKFADYSERAVEKALRELGAEVEKLLEERNLELLGVYSTVFLLLERGEFENAEEFLKGLNS